MDVAGRVSGIGMLPVTGSVEERCDGASVVVDGTGASLPEVCAGAMREFASILLSIGQGCVRLGGALISAHATG